MVLMNKLGADSIKEPVSYSLIWNSQLRAMNKDLSGQITAIPEKWTNAMADGASTPVPQNPKLHQITEAARD
jgi:hypothetical protein